ncbi:hypothetical protein K438DRAFT_1752494 [Mycena galopus ATCC 62051]|nr:hypothetical protein K438DRAFT_1752494 [Mycena galopus ATCC 62051]
MPVPLTLSAITAFARTHLPCADGLVATATIQIIGVLDGFRTVAAWPVVVDSIARTVGEDNAGKMSTFDDDFCQVYNQGMSVSPHLKPTHQRGERYADMDYVVFRALLTQTLEQELELAYDRTSHLPPGIKIKLERLLGFIYASVPAMSMEELTESPVSARFHFCLSATTAAALVPVPPKFTFFRWQDSRLMLMASTASSSRGKKRAAPTTEVLDWTLDDVLEGVSFTSQHVSEDKRRTYEKVHIVDLPSPLKKKQRNVAPAPFSDVGDGFEYVFEDLTPPECVAPPNRAVKARAKRYLSSVGFPSIYGQDNVLSLGTIPRA